MAEPDFTWIDHAAQLPALGVQLAAAPWIALDSEANSMFVYREQVCLLQLNVAGALYLIDTLALEREQDAAGEPSPLPAMLAATHRPSKALEPLRAALESPTVPIYVHGGEYDVGCLKRDYGISLQGVWDSQQAVSLLGWEKTGYGNVVAQVCGVTLDKAFTQYNWGLRPLDPGAVRYALDDIIYLPQICDQLRAQVAAADIEEAVAIANQAVSVTAWSGGFDPAGFWKIKGLRELPTHAIPLLCALYTWRDSIGRTRNQPPGRVLNSEVLLVLARQAPSNFQLLKKLGLRSWFLSAFGDELLETIRTALAQPVPVPPRPRPARDVEPEEEQRETRLKDWRRGEAESRTLKEERRIPLQLVLPAKSLEYLKQFGADDLSAVPQLGQQRLARYGDKLRDLCRRG